MSFWEDYAAEAQSKKYTGRTVADAHRSFWTETLPSVGKGVADSLYKPIEVMGEGLGTAIGEFSGANQQIQDNTSKIVSNNNATIKILQDRLKKEKDEKRKAELKASIDNLNNNTSSALAGTLKEFESQQKTTDPGHIANNAAQLALNVATAGTASTAVKGGGAAVKSFQLANAANRAANLANTTSGGLKILTKAQKAAKALEGSGLGTVAKAITNPTTIKEGAAAFGAVGATQGGLMAGDTKGATEKDIATGMLFGGALGAAGGTLAGFLGGRVAKATGGMQEIGTPGTSARIINAADEAAAYLDTQKATTNAVPTDADILKTAQATRAAVVENIPAGQVINGVETPSPVGNINPWDETAPQGPMTTQQLEEAATTPVPSQMQVPVAKPVSTITPGSGTTLHLPNRNVYADLTPEQAAYLSNETKNINQTDPNDMVHLTAGEKVKSSAKKVSVDEIKEMSPNAKAALETPKVGPNAKEIDDTMSTIAQWKKEGMDKDFPAQFKEHVDRLKRLTKEDKDFIKNLSTPQVTKTTIKTYPVGTKISGRTYDGNVYHKTNEASIADITKNGLVPSKKDGRLYFHQTLQENLGWGEDAPIIRTKNENVPDLEIVKTATNNTDAPSSARSISPDKLEVSYDNGKTWKSLAPQVTKTPKDMTLDELQSIPREQRTSAQSSELNNKILAGFSDVRKKFKTDQEFYDNFIIKEADKNTRSADLASEIMGKVENDNIPIKDAIDSSILPDSPLSSNEIVYNSYDSLASEVRNLEKKTGQTGLWKQVQGAMKGMTTDEKVSFMDDALKKARNDGTLLKAEITTPKPKSEPKTSLAKAAKKEQSKTMAAEITPGQKSEVVVNVTLTDKQVADAVAKMTDLKTKQKVKALKDLGATDEQLRNSIGVDSNNVKLKMREVIDTPPTPEDTPMSFKTTAEELAGGGNPPKGIRTDVADWLDANAPNAKSVISQRINKALAATEDTMTRMTETLGSFGANVGKKLLRAQKEASDIKTTIRPQMQQFSKLSKEIAGTGQPQRIAFGKKLNEALENRELGDSLFKTQPEKDLYNNAVTILDTIKAEMVKRGMDVRDNYTPYQMMKDFGDGPDWLKGALTSSKTRVESAHALPRRAEGMGELNDQNILDILPNYANGMIDHLAFSPVKKAWEEGIETVPAYIRRNSTNFNDGVNYANTAMAQMINRGSTSDAEKGLQKLTNAYYLNSLYMNPKNAMYSQLQKLQAAADTTSKGRSIADSLSKETKTAIRKHLWFGESTASQDAAIGANQAKTALGASFKKIDINRIGEASAVNQPFQWGFVDSIIKSDAYKALKAKGLSEEKAILGAMKNEVALNEATDAANMLINNTMFGSNSIARPEILRGGGIIKKAFGMFQRFPMAETNFVKKMFTMKDTRVLEMLQSADPTKYSIGERRFSYATTLSRMKEARKSIADATKAGTTIEGAPSLKVLDEQIGILKNAVDTTDEAIKALSNLRGPKRAAAFTAMWLGSGAVATMWNGVLNYGKESYKERDFVENLIGQDPTLISKVAPWMPYSVAQSGLTSPVIPFNKYGVNAQGVLNLVPGAGVVNRATGGYLGEQLNNIVKGK